MKTLPAQPKSRSAANRSWQAAAGIYFLVLSYLLLAPHPLWFLGNTGVSAEEAVDQTLADYLQHALAYAVMGTLLTLAASAQSTKRRWSWLAAAAAHGILCECLQHYIPDRTFDGRDALANAVGVIAGWGIATGFCQIPAFRTVTGVESESVGALD